MSKHTPGPYEVQDPMGADVGLMIVQSGLQSYEWVFLASVHQQTAPNIGQRKVSAAEQKANAQLFSAAPELLEALKDALRVLKELAKVVKPIMNDPSIEKAEMVIAKAEGRT